MPTRLICHVLAEMRACWETRNFSYFLGLVEEAQMMVDRMEAALNGRNDVEFYESEVREYKKQIRELKRERRELEDAIEGLKRPENNGEKPILEKKETNFTISSPFFDPQSNESS